MKKNGMHVNRQIYFDVTVKNENIKKTITGYGEAEFVQYLESIEYTREIDFINQYPIGDVYVIDIAFPEERVAIEIDGDNHKTKHQKMVDNKRDRFLRDKDWVVIRIPTSKLRDKAIFYKHLVKEIVQERRHNQTNYKFIQQ